MKDNPLLKNMQNKILDLEHTIKTCDRLLAGETIEINGLHRFNYSIKQDVQSLNKQREIKQQIIEEKNALEVRVFHLTKNA